MNCLSFDELLVAALPGPTGDGPAGGGEVLAHARECGDCAARLEELRTQFERVAAAHAAFEEGHAAARERLLRALPARPGAAARPGARRWFPAVLALPRRRGLVGAVAAALLGLAFGLTWLGLSARVAFADVTQALRYVRSYECRLTSHGQEGGEGARAGALYWAAPGLIRTDTREGERLVHVRIVRPSEPGLEIDYQLRTYTRLAPAEGQKSPLLLLDELAHYSGQADRDLGEGRVAGKRAWGFEIAAAKIDPDFGDWVLRVWADPATKRPVRVEFGQGPGGSDLLVLEDFRWDGATEGWFNVTPPPGFKDETPLPPTVEQQTNEVVEALRIYARYFRRYPRAEKVHADAAERELHRAAGLSYPPTPKDRMTEKYAEVQRAAVGLTRLNVIQANNFEARYYGKAVEPGDGGKVLFCWRLPGGEFRVIYGDLRAETVPAATLRDRERR